MALDYPSGSAFRNACQRYLGAAPHQVRARGGARYVIGELVARTHDRARTFPAAPPIRTAALLP
jgi:hypothetical protein